MLALVLMSTLVWAARPSISDEFTDRRITTGAKIFRALLAADVDISGKTGKDGNLNLCLLYVDDSGNAEKAAETLKGRDDSRIRKLGVRVALVPFDDWTNGRAEGFAGIFLTQDLSDEKLNRLLEDANDRKIVVFSPFEGDVERGAHSGIVVEARVRPYINTAALRHADVRLKSFFVRVAKHYGN